MQGSPSRRPMTIRPISLALHAALRLAIAGAVVALVLCGLVAACAQSQSAELEPITYIDAEVDAEKVPPPDPDSGSFATDAGVDVGPKFPLHPAPPPHGAISAGNVPSNAAALFGAAQVDTSAPPPVL